LSATHVSLLNSLSTTARGKYRSRFGIGIFLGFKSIVPREQLLTSRHFALTARADEYIGGVVIYWQVHFSHGEQSFSLNTAPESDSSGGYRRSHRGPKQVVMGLQKPLTVERGEKLVGIITLTPNFTQHRSSLGLQLATSFTGSKSEESEEREYLL